MAEITHVDSPAKDKKEKELQAIDENSEDDIESPDLGVKVNGVKPNSESIAQTQSS